MNLFACVTQSRFTGAGDWPCPNCHYVNWAMRDTCNMCNAPRLNLPKSEDHTTSPRSPRCRPPAPRSNLSDDQLRFCGLAESGCNVFLTGLGGTGKSHVLKLVVKNLRLKYGLGDRKLGRAAVMLASSTGVSAVSIGGVTLHSLAGCGVPRYAVHFERMWSRKKMWKTMRVWPSSSTATLHASAYQLDSLFFSFPFQVLVLDEVSMIQVRLLR